MCSFFEQWGINGHCPQWQSTCSILPKSQAWNRHLWKHWEEWREEHPWLEVRQTGLGCSICTSSNVKRCAWSKYKACREVAQTICPHFVVEVFQKQLPVFPLVFKDTSSCASKPRLWYASNGWSNTSKALFTALPKPSRRTTTWTPSCEGKRWG